MTLPVVGQANYPTPGEIRDAILRTIKLAFQRRGIAANVLPGSDHYITAEAIARRLGLVVANNMISAADMSPLTAEGERLDLLAGLFGVVRRPAIGSSGYVVVTVTGSAVIPAGYRAVAADGHIYQTKTAETVGPTNLNVEVEAIDTGESTNQDPDAVLTWESAAIGNLSRVAKADSDGLTGGSDEDTDEDLRERLKARLSFPGVGGNAANVRSWAEGVSAAVDQAFVYSAVRGPAAYDVAICTTSGDRTLSATQVANVAAYLVSQMPGNMSLNTTTVDSEGVDVVVYVKLPLPVHAGGAGGGWFDANPWPRAPEYGEVFALVGPDHIVVLSLFLPGVGSHVAMWDRDAESMELYRVLAATVSGPHIHVWLDRDVPSCYQPDPPVYPAVPVGGAFLSADAFNVNDYATTFSAQMRELGAGEKTANQDLLPRGLRHPPPDVVWPYAITSVQIAAMVENHPEVLDMSYGLRVATGTGSGGTPLAEPTLPTLTSDPPKILWLRNLAFVRG